MKVTKTFAVLHAPRQGSYSPSKLGTPIANFIKTRIPELEANGRAERWIAHGKVYEDMDEFTKMCDEVIPVAYRFGGIYPSPIIFQREVEIEDPAPAKKEVKEPAKKPEKVEAESPSLPSMPAISAPPEGATKKKVAKKKAKQSD